MIVTDITPNYYAAGTFKLEFSVTGSGFENLPNDVIGVISVRNDEPLMSRYETAINYYCSVQSKSDSLIVLTAAAEVPHQSLYLGGILSNDREEVYWVNTSNPLP